MATFIPKLFRAQRLLLCGRFLRQRSLALATIHGQKIFLLRRGGLSSMWTNVETATAALEAGGYRMLVKNERTLGQIVSRFLSPEGLLVGITFTPTMREKK